MQVFSMSLQRLPDAILNGISYHRNRAVQPIETYVRESDHVHQEGDGGGMLRNETRGLGMFAVA